MGLFRPFNESSDDLTNQNAMAKSKGLLQSARVKNADKMSKAAGIKPGDGAFLQIHKLNKASGSKAFTPSKTLTRKEINSPTRDRYGESKFASGRKPVNASASLLGLTDEEIWELNEGNCDSDTCKCKGGTCPVSVTDGISTSSAAAKKLANAGHTNQSDLNAVVPNAEYSRRNDAFFIGDGDSPETSKTNIPAILAARTAGGSPHGWTTDNGINGVGSNVFKLKKLKDDDDGPNG
jgi:hypothetical protein